jgi:hypothetical protein
VVAPKRYRDDASPFHQTDRKASLHVEVNLICEAIMTQRPPAADAIALARKLESRYIAADERKTFRAWILDAFFPEMLIETLPNGRDFYCAERTADVRFYLGGMLMSGSLPVEPLLQGVTEPV